jgi:hypothetical protein
VDARIKRALARMRELAPIRNECWEFFRGNSYVYRTQDNQLTQLATTAAVRGTGKPPHRVRTERPLLVPLIRHEVSACTQRVPSYEVTPTNTNPDTIAAAKVAQKVALYLYDKCRVKQVTEDVVTHAIVGDEGFAWPYWDNGAGPQVGVDEDGDGLYMGEICVRVYGANQVGWEPGVRYEDSPYYIVVSARPIEEVLAMPDILVTDLPADATSTNITGGLAKPKGATKLCMVTEYLERPSVQNPRGVRLTLAGGKLIFAPDVYPLVDEDGPVDEPPLLKLTVIRDPDNDRDMGLVRHALDCVRSFNDANNKALELKNLALNTQVIAPPNLLTKPLTDVPGDIIECMRPDLLKWRDPPAPALLEQLHVIADRAKADLGFILSQNDLPAQVESGRAIEEIIEHDQDARAAFIGNLAEFHSRLMRRMLVLAQQHYTEPRDIEIIGDFGPEILPGFLGADLMDQTTVRVLPGSLAPVTREAIEAKVMAFADRGWITPQAAMAAIDGGTAETLVQDYELDIGRANLIISKIKQGPQVLFSTPPGPQLTTLPDGEQVPQPGWMPRPFDNVAVHKQVFEAWMKSADWDSLRPDMQEAAWQYYQALLQIQAQQQAEQAQAQLAAAAGQGAANAAKPQPGIAPVPPEALNAPDLLQGQ